MFLLTRPREDSLSMQSILNPMGIDSFIEPIISITTLQTIGLENIQTVIATSRHGLRVIKGSVSGVSCFCVGSATVQVAKDMGFSSVYGAGQSVQGLVNFIQQHDPKALGKILYVAATHVTKNLEVVLSSQGYDIKTTVVYRAESSKQLTANLLEHFSTGAIKQVGFFSRRTGEIFMTLVDHHKVGLEGVEAFCLSDKIACILEGGAWKNIRIAEAPTTDSFWQLIKNHVK